MKLLSLTFVSACVLFTAPLAHAEKHPRINEVNARAKHLEEKTSAAEISGKITQAQAAELKAKEAGIQEAVKADAAAHNGHINRAEKKELNKEENALNRKLHREERRNAKKAATPPAAS
jgi:hypothetical protein